MGLLSKPAFGPKASLIYVTLGSLIMVWTGVYYVFKYWGTSMPEQTGFYITGFFLTGFTLLAIGLLVGQLGRAARRAELPPDDAMREETRVRQTEAANPNPVAPHPANDSPPPAGYQPSNTPR